MTRSVSLRRVEPADIEALLPMMLAFNRFESIAMTREKLVPALAALTADPAIGACWFIAADAEVAGYAVITFGFDLEWGGRDGWLTELWIEPAHRGAGLGRAALAALEREAIARGVRALHLAVRHDNEPAQALYRGAGFEQPDRAMLTKRL
jgi:ribosomal protein S18 acetylase RimI-like enzyme